MEIVRVRNLEKEYRIAKKTDGIRGSLRHLIRPEYEKKQAVKGISFSIAKGESVAFLGANGAGKSTTIKMLTGILQPSGGSVEVMDRDPFRDRMEHAKHIGVVFGQKTQLWWDIPVIETFRLLGGIYEIPRQRYQKNMELFSKMLGLREFLHQPARKLSLGQRVRADLAAALLHEPPLLFLDEPTIGLDVAVKQNIYTFLKKINKQEKTTIVLTSHDLNDLESLCERLLVLEQGEILFDGRMEEIYALFEEGMDFEQIVIRLFQRGKRL
ncbi:MAG: ATP-binding cassette domain-containing protein [Eubacterium sp.]|nr:ATP-binding cassette domain-containing protein [Eubacterium sp.]